MSFNTTLSTLLFFIVASFPVFAQKQDFVDRKEIILNICPHVELSGFSFANNSDETQSQWLSWRNIGSQALVAFEIVTLKYDVFDQQVMGTSWINTGIDSADWTPLAVGAGGRDGTITCGSQYVFTAIAYVRTARLADGTVWRVNETELVDSLRKVSAALKNLTVYSPIQNHSSRFSSSEKSLVPLATAMVHARIKATPSLDIVCR